MLAYQRTAERRVVNYWRTGSAGARIRPTDLPDHLIRDTKCLHISGITLALSESAAETAREALVRARTHGVKTSFDLNYRASLWPREAAASEFKRVLDMCDVLFATTDEACLIVGTDDPERAACEIAEKGPQEVLVTMGAKGAVGRINGQTIHAPSRAVTAIDATGAGDAFAAGYLAGGLEGADPRDCMELANQVAGVSVSTMGDWRGLPIRGELLALVRDGDSHSR
jgi:2-dehydro-3-deoxygluconokinase